MRAIGAILCALAAASTALAGTLPADPTTADVCDLIPGAEVAKAAGGRLVEALLVRPEGHHARCRYTVAVGEGKDEHRHVYLVWLHAPADFADLRRYQEDRVEEVDAIGDEACIAFHPDQGRHDLLALLRGVVALQVTAPQAAGARAVAAASVVALRRVAAGR